jgi:SAM-dependent methyltransferase
VIAPAQVEYWNRVAGEKTFGHPLDVGLLARLTGAGARVLDCGCGYGRLAGPIEKAGFDAVVGVDPSLEMARRARRAGLAVAVVDGTRLPFPDRAFDAALLISVLTCVPRDEDQRAIVGELERVLRPGGVVYASDLVLQNDERNRRRYEAEVAEPAAGGVEVYGTFRLEGAVFRHHERTWIEELFSRFDPVERRDIEVTTMNGHPARGFQWIGRKPTIRTTAAHA